MPANATNVGPQAVANRTFCSSCSCWAYRAILCQSLAILSRQQQKSPSSSSDNSDNHTVLSCRYHLTRRLLPISPTSKTSTSSFFLLFFFSRYQPITSFFSSSWFLFVAYPVTHLMPVLHLPTGLSLASPGLSSLLSLFLSPPVNLPP